MKITNVWCRTCEKSIVAVNSVGYANAILSVANKYNQPQVLNSLCQVWNYDDDEKEVALHLRQGHKIELLR